MYYICKTFLFYNITFLPKYIYLIESISEKLSKVQRLVKKASLQCHHQNIYCCSPNILTLPCPKVICSWKAGCAPETIDREDSYDAISAHHNLIVKVLDRVVKGKGSGKVDTGANYRCKGRNCFAKHQIYWNILKYIGGSTGHHQDSWYRERNEPQCVSAQTETTQTNAVPKTWIFLQYFWHKYKNLKYWEKKI